MEVTETDIAGVLLIEPRIFEDERGFFLESWNADAFAEIGLDVTFVQDNHSRSAHGVLRGMHYQQPGPQGKLVRVVAGAVYDAVVDLRRSSPSFGKACTTTLSAANRRMLWIPPGIAHGYLALENDTDLIYKCTAPYRPRHEHSILWNDRTLGIDWPLDGIDPILSAKDRNGTPFAQAMTFE